MLPVTWHAAHFQSSAFAQLGTVRSADPAIRSPGLGSAPLGRPHSYPLSFTLPFCLESKRLCVKLQVCCWQTSSYPETAAG